MMSENFRCRCLMVKLKMTNRNVVRLEMSGRRKGAVVGRKQQTEC
jgi:hypothetical protein